MQETKVKKLRAFFAVFLIIFISSSIFYGIHEAHHDCSGKDCHICHVIQICQQNIRLLTFALTVAAFFYEFSAFAIPLDSAVKKFLLCPYTLITQKIRLND
ncbi:hypothetical protein [Treponema sp.]|uniref:hypothetical protein n=1 Tax=Treponema sp. TaxID=166 RepID=UPI0025F087E3|nr:hypothetical protein [Treponema sp.]MCR5217436.1 hypothetical protein [Treponema sp.]